MPKGKKTNYSPSQLEELAGNYKDSDNRIPVAGMYTSSAKNEGDGVTTKRPQ